MQSSIEGYLRLLACEHFLSASTTVATVAVAFFLLQRPTVTDTSLFIPSNQDRRGEHVEPVLPTGIFLCQISEIWHFLEVVAINNFWFGIFVKFGIFLHIFQRPIFVTLENVEP